MGERVTTAASDEWTVLCRIEDVPPEGSGGRYVVVGRRAVAVYRVGDGVRVLDDVCPHAGGSLSAGPVAEGCAVCPWHGWAFGLEDGRCPDNPAIAVRTHRWRIVAGIVQVCLA
ncbi:MAG: Rieske 2Fe-2S domain-containing protein [Phycisphaeraceae bacterium]|nr:Rieske 2Fe-2S domain-containing protein [Phycisphaeraceae bacterium]